MQRVPPRAPALVTLALLLPLALSCSDDPTAPRTPSRPSPTNRWSDPQSWPDRALPQAGAAVVISAGQEMLLDVSPPPLKSLQIKGRLVFEEKDLALAAEQILVEGSLEVGSQTAPFRHRAVITLTGSAAASPDIIGNKVLAVLAGGRLELHGLARTSWTRLAATAMQGSTQLLVERTPEWEPGDRLVIASTDYDPLRAEEAVVRSVSGGSVALDQPLRYSHWGELQSFAGRTLDERAEVGLLSRNVVVRGDDASVASGLGGHLIVVEGGLAHIEGVEFYLMGQRGRLARYPIHWHLTGSVDGQYVRGSSIWRSFNRCLTIHGAHGLLVERNVCYDNPGHAYFLEDGIETRNTLDGNLGLLTRVPAVGEQLLGSDARAATFWITNPDNAVRGNVAAGSQKIGFWYALPEHPTGPSTTEGVWPRRTPLREFANNVAHSNRDVGLNVDHGPKPDGTTETTYFTPRQSPTGQAVPVVAELKNFTAWKHGGRAVWLRGNDMRLVGAMLADNAIGATFAARETFLQDAVAIGESANNAIPLTNNFPIRGFEFYDGRVAAQRVTFVNYEPNAKRQASGIGFLRANAFGLNTGNFVEGVQFVNANRVYLDDPRADRDGDKASIFLDRDGSVTGSAGSFVVVNTPILLDGSCTRRVEWNAYACASRYVQLQARSDAGENVAPLVITRDDGSAVTMTGGGNQPLSVSMSLLAGRAYVLRYPGTVSKPRLFFYRMAPGDWLRVAIPYAGAAFVAWRDYDASRPLAAVGSLAELDASAGDKYYRDASGMLHFKVVPKTGRDNVTIFVDPR